MKISVLLVGLFCLALPIGMHAQDPGAQQDAEAAREKLLKAADQLDLIETNSEATKASLENMKADIAKLQDENTALKQQLADLQAAFDKAEAAHAKERQVLLDEVAKMVAAGKGAGATKLARKKDAAVATPSPAKAPEAEAPTASPAPTTNNDTPSVPDPSSPATATNDNTPSPVPAQPQKGYYHVVATGETLTLICTAYREQGINVTVGEIEKANGLTDKSLLKVGQKLFIPKPGT